MLAETGQARPGVEETYLLLDLVERMVLAKDLRELAEPFLESIATLIGAPATVLSFKRNSFPKETFFQVGLAPEAVPAIAGFCEERLRKLPAQAEPPPETLILPQYPNAWFHFYRIRRGEENAGLFGLLKEDSTPADSVVINKALAFFACALNKMIDQKEHEIQIDHLNIYMNISSMIAQALDLRDVLEAVLYFCMEAFGVEAASVLLLDYEKENFRFYSAEGPAKPVLLMASFPSNHGLAGAVLASQQAEIINDVQNDPRFFKRFDQESGFFTRNMIAFPLTAGEEKIGILQIINKFEGDFQEEDLLFLQTIAEEIAFAIRNAKLFEVVVKSYCKQRQGEPSCRGCKRPLGSWTPCVKYREELGLLT
jgi:hypothetical protein